jgi:hypothetical protein
MEMECCLFDRPHHQRIEKLLDSLDADLLASHQCLFGGGTAIALKFGEYRESRGVDFLVSAVDAYREIRAIVTTHGIAGLFTSPVKVLREARMDQYGIRAMVEVGGEPIKFEIVLEGRIVLDVPGPGDVICRVRTLTTSDMAAEKLLANSDRWSDDSVQSRDLIDLAMMLPNGKIPRDAVANAARAYSSIEDDLKKAIEHLTGRPGRIQECMVALQMTMPAAQAMDRIRKLRVQAVVAATRTRRPR